MSRRKREPVAEIGAEDYRIVRHTHDIAEATVLMRALLGDHREVGCDERCYTDGCEGAVNLGKPQQEWIRIVPALPNTYAAGEGWKFTYQSTRPRARGAFRAVVFW